MRKDSPNEWEHDEATRPGVRETWPLAVLVVVMVPAVGAGVVWVMAWVWG